MATPATSALAIVGLLAGALASGCDFDSPSLIAGDGGAGPNDGGDPDGPSIPPPMPCQSADYPQCVNGSLVRCVSGTTEAEFCGDLGCLAEPDAHCAVAVPRNQVEQAGTTPPSASITLSGQSFVLDSDSGQLYQCSEPDTPIEPGDPGALGNFSFAAFTPGITGSAELGVFEFAALTVEADASLRLIGSRPAVLFSRDVITIAGHVDASGDREACSVAAACGELAGAERRCAGPGGSPGGSQGQAGGGDGGGSIGAGGTGNECGGGGGGYGGSGGDGGSSCGGAGGATYGGEILEPLVGGSGGASGEGDDGAGRVGGGGGGAVQIVAYVGLIIEPGGGVRAGGGGGSRGSDAGGTSDGGGGGGSGGGILLESNALQIDGYVAANGGGGGGGNAGGGADGAEPGRTDDERAAGGGGGYAGGLGGAGSTPTGAQGEPVATNNTDGSAGGGGGVGRIHLRGTTVQQGAGAVISPAPSTDPSFLE